MKQKEAHADFVDAKTQDFKNKLRPETILPYLLIQEISRLRLQAQPLRAGQSHKNIGLSQGFQILKRRVIHLIDKIHDINYSIFNSDEAVCTGILKNVPSCDKIVYANIIVELFNLGHIQAIRRRDRAGGRRPAARACRRTDGIGSFPLRPEGNSAAAPRL